MNKNLKKVIIGICLVLMTIMVYFGCSFLRNYFRSDKTTGYESAFDCVLENRSTIGQYGNACAWASMQILLRACLEKEGLLKGNETIFERYAQQCIDVANRKYGYKKSIEEFEEIFSRPCLSAPEYMPNSTEINKEQAFLVYIADSLDTDKYDKEIIYPASDEKKSEMVNTVLEAVNLKKKLYTCYIYDGFGKCLDTKELGKGLIRHFVKKGLPVAASSYEDYNEETGEIKYYKVTNENLDDIVSKTNYETGTAIGHTKVINGFCEDKDQVYVNDLGRQSTDWIDNIDFLNYQYVYYFIDDEFLEKNTPIWIPCGKDVLNSGDKVYLAINNAYYNPEKGDISFFDVKIGDYDALDIRLCDGEGYDKALFFINDSEFYNIPCENCLRSKYLLNHNAMFFIHEITIPQEYDGIKMQDLIDKKLIEQA